MSERAWRASATAMSERARRASAASYELISRGLQEEQGGRQTRCSQQALPSHQVRAATKKPNALNVTH